jgi:hypothetical protein
LIPTSVEEEHLATAKSLADRIERLQAMMARDGESRKSKDGTVRAASGAGGDPPV